MPVRRSRRTSPSRFFETVAAAQAVPPSARLILGRPAWLRPPVICLPLSGRTISVSLLPTSDYLRSSINEKYSVCVFYRAKEPVVEGEWRAFVQSKVDIGLPQRKRTGCGKRTANTGI